MLVPLPLAGECVGLWGAGGGCPPLEGGRGRVHQPARGTMYIQKQIFHLY